MNLDGDVAEGQAAYDVMVRALAEGDEKAAAKAHKIAESYMVNIS